MVSGPTVQALRSAAHAVTSTDHRTALVAIQTAQDALDAAKAHHLAALERTAEYELDGASTVAAWARDHLRLDARQTRSLINADATMRELPQVADAAVAGQVRLDHLKLFTFGLKHIGHQVVTDAESWLLAVATTHEPVQLRRVVRALRDAVFPEALDEAWINGMAKEDIQLSPVPEGWHLTGFLRTEIGAKLKAVLESLSVPTVATAAAISPVRSVSDLLKARSASTASRVGRSSIVTAAARTSASDARICSTIAPWPASGIMSSWAKRSLIASDRPSRSSPATARIAAWTLPSPTC